MMLFVETGIVDGNLVEALKTLIQVGQSAVEVTKSAVSFAKIGFSAIVLVIGALATLVAYIWKDHKKHSEELCKIRHQRNDAEHAAVFSALDEIAPRSVRTLRVIHQPNGDDA